MPYHQTLELFGQFTRPLIITTILEIQTVYPFTSESLLVNMYPNHRCSNALMRIYNILDPASFDNGMSFLPKNRLPISQMYFILIEIENSKITPPVVNLRVLFFRELRGSLPRMFRNISIEGLRQ